MPAAGWTKMSAEELRLASEWYAAGESCSEIADKLGRNKSAITRLLVKQVERRPQGRPRLITNAKLAFLKRKLKELVQKADAHYTVTVTMLKKACKLKHSAKTIAEALHKEGIYFRRLREKPLLTALDVKARLAFARAYAPKTKHWWCTHVHAAIDGKFFKANLTGEARARAAQRVTSGAYRAKGEGLDKGYVKPKGALNYNTGARSILIVAGTGNGKMLMWHQVRNGRWNGKAAADMYSKGLASGLHKAYPSKRRFCILEDNDPAGFKSKRGMAAKRAANLSVLEIPRRSPDLNVMDYAIWSEVNRRMRRQEQKWPASKRETRAKFAARLRRTALNLPAAFIRASMGDMKRRCELVLASKGGFFQEGS